MGVCIISFPEIPLDSSTFRLCAVLGLESCWISTSSGSSEDSRLPRLLCEHLRLSDSTVSSSPSPLFIS